MRLAIYGYGNLGRGVEMAAAVNPDVELTGIFTRRDPASVSTVTGVPVYGADTIPDHKSEIDVVVICGGPEHFAAVTAAAEKGGTTALISGGWDPGMFSLSRLYANAILPEGSDYTFWGRGVSQGHSDAIRRIPGVMDARQYTVPVPEALEAVRSGSRPELTTRQKHRRECWVVAEEGADRAAIEQAIVTMPNYFDEYDTSVNFITEEELQRDHAGLPHGGFVIRTGTTGANGEHVHTIEYRLTLDSNPEFTGSVLVALARAVDRIHRRGHTGCLTVFDVAPADLSPMSGEELRAHML